ncbi:hypothetical protein CKAH01_12952 [Colletotrichum kahawae]|uniref:Uncharacterized protein n=1 Tax=Colletotrichum kahawae TaxID=34407 RepID=A0AAD9YTW2_COLKA|nr:hypothetical protein CKAH01_12952 [Colletotrichum kahawae]
MAKHSVAKRVLGGQKGFDFPSGAIIANQDTVRQIMDAVVPVDWQTAKEDQFNDLRQEMYAALLQIFHCLFDHVDLYGALRGHEAFYSTIASEITTNGDLNGDLVRVLEQTYTAARRRYTGHPKDTDLTDAVDAWIRIQDTFADIPALQTISLTTRPNDVGALAAQLQGTSITGANANASVWPPAHFLPQDIGVISSKNLRSLLHGRTTQTPGQLPPHPTKYTLPLQVRGFLCSLALGNLQPTSVWQLALNPVAQFQDFKDRRLWSKATGGESMYCFTVHACAKRAIDDFSSGKSLSVALLTPWFGRPWGSVPSIDSLPGGSAGQTQQQLWSGMCPRMGFGLAIHKIGGTNVELVLFDPIRRYDHVKNDQLVKANQMAIFRFRQTIQEKVQNAVRAAGGRLIRVWYGGYVAMDNGADSVQLASEWVRQVVAAGGPGQDPLAVNDATWVQSGFELIECDDETEA